jgi:hypothetical protein
MNSVTKAAFGWLLPGGVYLLARRYAQFALTLSLVCTATISGIALHGSILWPRAGELQGLDGFTALMAQAGGLTRILAGAPYLLARVFGYSQTFLGGQTHEAGTVLLALGGLINLLALADAL